jgi:chromosome segregation ATPase
VEIGQGGQAVNHIGDTNKMVSDTPRTDTELEFDPTSVDEVLDWSRQLERELHASNAIIRQQQLLDEENLRLQNRIKRLEEDLMDAKNKHAALVADVALYEDRGERIKRLEEELNDNGLVLQKIQHERDGSNDHIKRLDEYIHNLQKLGDSMALGRNPFIQNAWDAAKEAKP